jgi:hypothetical protein
MIVKDNNPQHYVVNLLCGTCKTCPDIAIMQEEDKVILTDDYGGINTWSMENFREFVRQSKEGSFDQFMQ